MMDVVNVDVVSYDVVSDNIVNDVVNDERMLMDAYLKRRKEYFRENLL